MSLEPCEYEEFLKLQSTRTTQLDKGMTIQFEWSSRSLLFACFGHILAAAWGERVSLSPMPCLDSNQAPSAAQIMVVMPNANAVRIHQRDNRGLVKLKANSPFTEVIIRLELELKVKQHRGLNPVQMVVLASLEDPFSHCFD